MIAVVIGAAVVLTIALLLIAAFDERRSATRKAAKVLAELRAFRMHSDLRVRRAKAELKDNRRYVDDLGE